MKKCCIVGGGDFSPADFRKERYELIIAADSGLKYLEETGTKADICIGDFDSLGRVPENENVIKLPVEKDDTDTSAALKYALKNGYNEIDVYGSLGGSRFSHSVANLQLMLYAKNRGANVTLIGKNCKAFLLRNEERDIEKHSTVSVFSVEKQTRITESEMKYPFDGYMTDEFPLGVSNSTDDSFGKITVKEGTALVIIE